MSATEMMHIAFNMKPDINVRMQKVLGEKGTNPRAYEKSPEEVWTISLTILKWTFPAVLLLPWKR